MKHIKPQNGEIRSDGRRYDGTTWRKVGINHHFNEDGFVYYKRKFRSLEGYLQQGGNISRLVFGKIKKPKAITKIANLLYDKEKSGHVYIITNPAWKGWLKVGMAIDAEDRCNSYQTSSPFRDFKLVSKEYFNNRMKAERAMHSVLKVVSLDNNGEWFKVSERAATTALKQMVNKNGKQEEFRF